jgi:hypothetical protein
MNSTKIENLRQLDAERERLRRKIRKSEGEITHRLGYLQKNYPGILLHQILPFNETVNERIASGISLGMGLFVARFSKVGKEFTDGIVHNAANWLSKKFGIHTEEHSDSQ